jgi:peptide-methionine (S)-S-oxide reductase
MRHGKIQAHMRNTASGWTSLVAWQRVSLLGIIAAMLLVASYSWGEDFVVIPAPVVDNARAKGAPQVAVLAGGCFWGIQGVYEHVRGVRKAISGYSGGDKASAIYEVVSSGRTGHAESVQITFDPAEISFGQILQIYFSVAHDPTQLDRQGPDRGPQYRSAIFYMDDSQKKIAEAYIAQLNKAKAYSKPIVTRVDPYKAFYWAEPEHQDFLVHNPNNPYIVTHDLPKIANLRKVFPAIYNNTPIPFDGLR